MNCWQFDSLQHRATSIGMRHRYRSRRGEVKLLLLAEPQSAGPAWRRVLAGWRGLQIIDPGTRKLRPLAEERSPEISSRIKTLLRISESRSSRTLGRLREPPAMNLRKAWPPY